ncbi:hypothetical protein OEIGOIKO_04330 [Streptomyces chrestomyceticus JCM 4735]|uniref:Secreted protein n=1 Tax=Streptomyces chrestomyceticus JCM 4735 TaxID=1306181 RepID=A0A7U9KWA7_9ACTN|nr:hypothetical protein OEIGOIKO_04330 [Streptomyces chrestomyceticus JCM 4735]
MRNLGVVLTAGAACVLFSLIMTMVPGLRTPGSGNAGQAYGAAASSTAVLVLFYMARTLRLQRDETSLQREELELQRAEMRLQRAELELQRDEMRRSAGELHRSAEADLRHLHMDLLKMSIGDPELAEVWPAFAPELTPKENRQYLYANLIYCHSMLAHKLEMLDDREALGHLRYIVRSPAFRGYWESARSMRAEMDPASHERRFAALVDEALTQSNAQAPYAPNLRLIEGQHNEP